ncbi:MAG: hypothetical protein ACRC10_09000 [Thermoguttaceae bacterium]
MNRLNQLTLKKGLILGGFFLLISGCASLRDYRIDPTGSCLFSRQQSGVTANTSGESSQNPTVTNPSATGTPIGTNVTNVPSSTSATTSPTPFTYEQFPGGFGAAVAGTGRGYGGIVRGSDNYTSSPAPDPVVGPALLLAPKVHFAPINSEVIIVASYLGKDNYLRTNEIVDWSLDGVGNILTYDTGSWTDWLHLDFSSANKTNSRSAKTKTSSSLWTIDRGTPDTKDDVEILKGQTWITVHSTKEGSTYISALAPSIEDWSKRTAGSVIHWIDAQFAFPRASIAPVGENRTLTTIVSRQTTGTPRPGWFVEYEIIGGPSAGLGESRAQRTKVETDGNGQASIEVYPNDMTAGTAIIAVRVIRPADSDNNEGELIVASDTIRQTWTTGGVLSIKLTAPQNAVAGQDLPYLVKISNSSQNPSGAMVRLTLPNGLKYVRSTPPISSSQGNILNWEISSVPGIPGHGSVNMEVILQAEKEAIGTGGMVNVRAEVFPKTNDAPFSNIPGPSSLGLPATGSSTSTTQTPYAPQQGQSPNPQPGQQGQQTTGVPSDYGQPTSQPRTSQPDPSQPDQTIQPVQPASIKTAFYIGIIDPGDEQTAFNVAPENALIVGEKNRVVVFSVINESGRELNDVRLVLYPPEENRQRSNALTGNPLLRDIVVDRENRLVQKFPTVAPNQRLVMVVQYDALRPASQIDIIAEVFAEGKKIGTYSIKFPIKQQ